MSQQSTTAPTSSQNQLSQNSNLFELENQFILRLPVVKEDGHVKPHPAALKLREALQKANQSATTSTTNADSDKQSAELKDDIKDRLFIELNSETRKGKIKFDEDVFEARLVDLPCIIESLKTSDKKTFFKTNDICQMLVCKTKDDAWSSSEEGDEAAKKEKKDSNKSSKKQAEQNGLNKKYLWPHGIAPPLKNVRRKRFRKVAKKKIIDYCEIEKEVKQLFRADREAVKVDYEVVLVDGELEDENLDEENKNLLDDDSSQEDENNQMNINTECSNTGYLDSIQDNLTSNTTNPMGVTNTKVKKQIEESNMSSAMDDEDSIMITSKVKLNDKPTTFDEFSNDNSNFATTSSKPTNKYFVEEVIGDLSSSSDENDDDEDENKDSENDESKLDASATVHHNEESNFDDFANESKEKSSKNIDLHDANTMDGEAADEDDDDDDEENKEKNNFPSSLSSSPSSNKSAANNKAEMRNKLAQLEDELKRIKEERRKREIEISSINNPVLKKHLSSRLNNLIDDESKKTNEIEELKSLLNE